MFDLQGELKRIQSSNNNETFDRTTDSLEAIANAIATSSQGLCYYGIVTGVPGANQFTCANLAGLGDAKFTGAVPYYTFVLRDAGGAAAAPQGEAQQVAVYVSGSGTFTTAAFSAAIAVGDEVLIVYPWFADIEVLIARLTAARAANLDSCTYLEQNIPLAMNLTQSLTNVAGDKDFIATNTRGGQGLISTTDAKMQKAFLLILGVAVNNYAGTNALDCTTAAHNQWKMNLDGGAYSDLVNGAFADGQMLDNDWRCAVEGAAHPFSLLFDITSQLTNVNGLIGVRFENGRSKQSSLIVTANVFLKILWKL